MALLEILTVPDSRLRERALPVPRVDQSIRKLMNNMAETLCDAKAAGLAAPQVGERKRVIVVDTLQKEYPSPLLMANPEIKWASPARQSNEEGCLSIPGYYQEIERPLDLNISYIDENNTPQGLVAKGFLAHCIHHEIDHLNGVLFIDYLTPLKRTLIIKKVIKNNRLQK